MGYGRKRKCLGTGGFLFFPEKEDTNKRDKYRSQMKKLTMRVKKGNKRIMRYHGTVDES